MSGHPFGFDISRRDVLRAGLATATGFGLGCDRHSKAVAAESARREGHNFPDVEVVLRAAVGAALLDPASGRPTEVWRFEGRVIKGPADALVSSSLGYLGPTFRVRPGQRVRVRFDNDLAESSIVHWHGLDVSEQNDGHPRLAVGPGGHYAYEFQVTNRPGTYWYHPHPHMLTAEQVYRGLAGPIIVRAADDPLAELHERHLFISDLKLAADGTVAPNDMMDWMNGREGQFVLVNGVRRPRIVVSRDERWRVWNASSARYVRLTFDDGRRFAQVGTDGGLLESPREDLTELLLVPGERAELIVCAASAEGARTAPSRAVLTAAVYDRSKMAMTHGSLPPEHSRALADVEFTPAADAKDVEASGADTQRASAQAQRLLPRHLRTIASLGTPTERKSVVFSEQMDMAAMHRPGASNHGMPAGMSFMINGASYDPSRVTLTSRRGEVELWSIENRTDMDHPFHLHGTQFQVVERESDGVTIPEPFRAWRDMVNVKPGETVRIATLQSMPGERMFHCHILEHEDLGMMGTLKVI